MTTVLDTQSTRPSTSASLMRIAGESVSLQMLKAGFTWWYERYAPDDQDLERAQTKAKTQKRGLWAHPNVVPPWEWQRGEGHR
jgi:endonuclease YncB( thermonuclease family)